MPERLLRRLAEDLREAVVDNLNARFVDELPRRLIGDNAYDSNKLDAELAAMGVDMISPNHSTRLHQTQDAASSRATNVAGSSSASSPG